MELVFLGFYFVVVVFDFFFLLGRLFFSLDCLGWCVQEDRFYKRKNSLCLTKRHQAFRPLNLVGFSFYNAICPDFTSKCSSAPIVRQVWPE